VAVVATLSKGYDLEYIWKQVDRGPAKDAAGYYIQASESGGEPPGRWWGPGAKALGLEPGQVVEREAYDLLFGERKAPDGTQLGRPPANGRKAADIYAGLLAAEPHATGERRRELRLEAARQARQGPLFFDLTISLSKSISIFHASLGENVRVAREAGDAAGEGYWSGLVGEVDDMIWQAVRAGFDYFQREAGYTRTGSHNTRVHGRETGQWREADLAVAHWLQHTSRDGDMQLHVHSQIAHVAKTVTDGKWRAPDSLGYNEHIGAVAAIVSEHLEEALTGRFGVAWEARDDGHGFEIKGHLRGDESAVLFAPRVHHGRPACPRGAVRAAVWPRTIPARTGPARAIIELQDARRQARRTGLRAGSCEVGGQARADSRLEPSVGRAVGVARRQQGRRGRAHARPG
jgi:TrwC relaxase